MGAYLALSSITEVDHDIIAVYNTHIALTLSKATVCISADEGRVPANWC